MMPQTALLERCALVADDLTGACDAAVTFRLRGASTMVCLTPEIEPASDHQVIAVSTESRDLDASAIRQRMHRAVSWMEDLRPMIVFKKIDSTLRGNVGVEVAAALEAFGCQCAVITPAFPGMGRVIREGCLHLETDAGWKPVPILKMLQAQGLGDCVHVDAHAVANAIERNRRFISVEAESDGHLEALVEATLPFGRRVLYAGSAGLAAALAKALCQGRVSNNAPGPVPQPCVFCIGSDHPVTAEQLAVLAGERPVECFTTGAAREPSLAACLQADHHGILLLPRGKARPEHIRALLENAGALAALFLSGGDTASLVCGALEVQAIELEGEIVTGLPWGRLCGGPLDGLPVATKSGGFGSPNALVKVVDFFKCARN